MFVISQHFGFIPQKRFLSQKTTYSTPSTGININVPLDCRNITVKAWGGGAGGGASETAVGDFGAAGGYTSSTITVVPGEPLIFRIAGGGGGGNGGTNSTGGPGGINGGGNGGDANPLTRSGGSGGGGGYTGIFRNTIIPLIIAAGGGGGGAGDDTINPGQEGGAGGGLTGIDGVPCITGGTPQLNASGKGGTQSAGGAAGVGINQITNPTPGSYLQGGNSGYGQNVNRGGGGGGGGGYYGGGGGCAATQPDTGGSGGGGGSSYIVLNGVNSVNIAGSGQTPPNTGDSDYISGVGVGGNAAALPGGTVPAPGFPGGNGLLVVTFTEK